MKMKTLAALALTTAMAATTAAADLVIPDLSYRTGPYAAGGTPFSDGYQDYFNLLNARDGGIGGEAVRIVECETGYNTEKGVECYEATKGEGALIYQPLSTGITYQLIPKATVDEIPLHTMGEQNGSDLSGKKVALVYHNSAYGKEPIRTLEELSAMHGFELVQLAVDHPGQEQKSQWLQIRRERPDYVLMWGWGVMNQVAVQEAANIGFPMENFIGNWWSGAEHDVTPAGAAANGYKSLNMNRVDADLPVFGEIKSMVHEVGNAAGDGSNIGSVLYTRGMYAAMLAAEAIAKAQEIHGVADVTPQMVRDGMANLDITEAPRSGQSSACPAKTTAGPALALSNSGTRQPDRGLP